MESSQARLSRPRLTAEQEHSIIVSGLTHVISGEDQSSPWPTPPGVILTRQHVPMSDRDSSMSEEEHQSGKQIEKADRKRKKRISKPFEVKRSAADKELVSWDYRADKGSAFGIRGNGIMLNFSNVYNGDARIDKGPRCNHSKREEKNVVAAAVAAAAKSNGRGVIMDEKELVEWMDSMVDNNCCRENCSTRQQDLLLQKQQGHWKLLN